MASQVGLGPDQYTLALKIAARANELDPANGMYLNTLGVAQYRVGKYVKAAKTLLQSDELNRPLFTGSHPADIAFLAMAHHQLGHTDQAHMLLEQLRELVQIDRWKSDMESLAFFKEAVDLISTSADSPVVAPQPTKP